MNETLSHAVQRMRSQGYSDAQIAGQIHHWHAGWTPGRIMAVVHPQSATKAPETYHGVSREPTFPGQKPFRFLGRARVPLYEVGHGKAGSSTPLETVLGAPAKGVSQEQSQAELGRVYQQNHPVGQQLIEGFANAMPGVALAKGIDKHHVGLGTLGAEAFNDVSSGLLPLGKAAAVFGGFRGLRRASKAVSAAEDVAKTAKVIKAKPLAKTAKTAKVAEDPGVDAEIAKIKADPASWDYHTGNPQLTYDASRAITALRTARAAKPAAEVAKVHTPTEIEAMRAEHADLEAKYNSFLEQFVEKKLTPDELKRQREEINPLRGKYKKQQSGKTSAGKASGASGWKVQQLPKNVREEKLQQMEEELFRLARAHPNDPGARAFLAASDRMDELRHLIGQHEEASLGALPGTAAPEPAIPKSAPVPEQPAALPEPVSDPFDHPAPVAAPDLGAQLRPVLSGRAARDALKKMGSFEKAGARSDPNFGLSARRAYAKEKEMRTEERVARFKKANAHLQNTALEPAERVRLWKDEMRGELPKIKWRGFDELTPESVKAMARYAMDEAPNLHDTQRVKIVDALENALDGTVPRPHELRLLEHVFGKDVTQGYVELARNPFREAILGVLNVPRTLRASMDFSAPLRQGLILLARHPIVSAKNFPEMFKAFGRPFTMRGENYFQRAGEEIKSRPTFPLMLEADLPLTSLDRGIAHAEEPFMGANVAEKFTGGKRFSPVRATDRAYTLYLDKTRADVFDLLIRHAQGESKSLLYKGVKPVDIHNEKFLKDLGRFIGNASGRGTFDHEALEKAMPLLNIGLFSPRLIASRVQMLNPYMYYKLDPFVRREALASALATFGAISTVLGLAKMGGAKVETDWRSSDFGKIRIGNTRIDIAGGFQQYFHLLGELYTGEKKSTSTGEISSLTHPKFGQPSTLDALTSFGRNKLAPIPGAAIDLRTGTNSVGDKVTPWSEVRDLFVPLIWQDVHDLYNHPVHGMNGLEAAILGYGLGGLGVGINTYPARTSKSGSGDPFDSSSDGSGDPFDTGPGASSGDPFDK